VALVASFGWDSVVAIATLALAAATTWLAWTTRRVARAAIADLHAQWRPMIVPFGDPSFGADPETGQWTTVIGIQNSGPGPALYVRATLDPVNQSPQDWSLGGIPPRENRELRFTNLPNRDVNYQLLLDYRDLAGRLYSSSIVIDFPAEPDDPHFHAGRVYDVNLFEDTAVTQLGDSVPQPGLQEVGPRRTRGIGRRITDALSGAIKGARNGFRGSAQ
jgi:hypothetical protein